MKFLFFIIIIILISTFPLGISQSQVNNNSPQFHNSNPGFIYETLILQNSTLTLGNFIPHYANRNPSNIFYYGNYIFVSYPDGSVLIFNATSFAYIDAINSTLQGPGFVYDYALSGVIIYGSSAHALLVNPSNVSDYRIVDLNTSPIKMIYDSTDNLLYSLTSSGEVDIINGSTFELIKSIHLFAGDILYDPLNGLVYILNLNMSSFSAQSEILVYNNTSYKTTFKVPGYPIYIVLDTRNNYLILNQGDVYSDVISASDGNQISRIGVPGYSLIYNLYYSPENNYVYLIFPNVGIIEVETINGTFVSSINTGAQGSNSFQEMCYDSQSQSILFLNIGSNTISIIPLNKYEITFSENGLESGLQWGVTLNGRLFYSRYSDISITVKNGTYNYTISSPAGYNILQNTGKIVINGSSFNVILNFVSKRILLPVYIYDAGLAPGAEWKVTISNFTEYQNNTVYNYEFAYGFMKFYLPSGNYSYSISAPGYSVKNSYPSDYTYSFPGNNYQPDINALETLNSSGTISVNETSPNYLAYFVVKTYNISFIQHGLPQGTYWMVNISGSIKGTYGNMITFGLPNGTYNYQIYTTGTSSRPVMPFSGIMGYTVDNSSGTVKVNSSGQTILTRFLKKPSYYFFNISFEYYPSGFPLAITVNNITEYTYTVPFISFFLLKGNYTARIYEASLNRSFFPTFDYYDVKSLNFTLTKNNNENYTFKQPSGFYLVKILSNYNIRNASILGYVFSKNGNLTTFFISTNTSAYIYLRNGTYQVESLLATEVNYSIDFAMFGSEANNSEFPVVIGSQYYASLDKKFNSYSLNNVTVNGANVSVTTNFEKYFTITFREHGIPNGTAWSVTLGGKRETSYNDSITFQDLNGSYNYTIEGPEKFIVNSDSGSLMVDGGNVSLNISFYRLYTLSFIENGLPLGTTWSISINRTVYSSQLKYINISLIKGNYSIIISNVTGFVTNFHSGNINLTGDTNMSISYYRVYAITVEQTGLYKNNSWSVTIQGKTSFGVMINETYSSNNNSIIFYEPNGNYTLTFHYSSTYYGSGTKINLAVDGSSKIISIKIYPVNYLPEVAYILAAVIIIIAILFKRNRTKYH